MEHALPRPGLNGSALVDLLARMGLAEGPSARPSFVDGLERWLGWTDAIALSAVLGAREPEALASLRQAPIRAAAAARQGLARLQATLARRIEQDGLGDDDLEFTVWRRHVHEVRQAMQAEIPPLRAQLRGALASGGASQRRLAALDAVLEQALAPREQASLAALPAWLHKRFEQGRPGDAAGTRVWLQAFRQDMRRLLHAELELRLQPLLGLLEAMEAAAARDLISPKDD